MKKILVVSTRFPFPLYSGDRLRIFNIAKNLSRKHKVDFIYTASNQNIQKKIKFINKTIFIKTNIFISMLNAILFLFQGKPLQVGYFFSGRMKKKINEIHNNYDCIIFHLIRAGEYLPKNYKGRKIIEMTDIISKNYDQLYRRLSIFNPLKYIYFLEKLLLVNYEKKIVKIFNKVILVSKNDLNNPFFKNNKKIKVITNGTDLKKKIYNFKKSNKDVIFFGNINYIPNKIACFDFIKKIMPELQRRGYEINFKIIGQTSFFLKLMLTRFKNVEVHTNIKNPEKLCNKAICGIGNLNIATGVQNKILEYMRVGIPAIVSEKCFNSINFKKELDLMIYKNNKEFINNIIKIKNNKKIANKISNNCYKKIKKNYKWETVLKNYQIIV